VSRSDDVRTGADGAPAGADEAPTGADLLDALLDELPHLTDGDIMALAAFRSGEDAAVLSAARERAEAAVSAAGRDAELGKARDKIARWAEKVGGGEVSGFLGGTDGMRRLDQRMDAIPAVLDAALAFMGAGVLDATDVVTLTAAWNELEAGDEDEPDLDALSQEASADPDDPSGARL
jgi:hypothetical protein